MQQLQKHDAIDKDRALEHMWQELEYYWEKRVFERNTRYAIHVPQQLNDVQQALLLHRMNADGWTASVEMARVTNASCEVRLLWHHLSGCFCECSAIEGDVDIQNHYLSASPFVEFTRRGVPFRLYGTLDRVMYAHPRAAAVQNGGGRRCDSLTADDIDPVQMLFLDTTEAASLFTHQS